MSNRRPSRAVSLFFSLVLLIGLPMFVYHVMLSDLIARESIIKIGTDVPKVKLGLAIETSHDSIQHDDEDGTSRNANYNNTSNSAVSKERDNNQEGCAIAFFGLPRVFANMVLPSLETHVLPHNVGCDYFVHYYDQTEEPKGRSSAGGAINSTEVLLLKESLQRLSPTSRIFFSSTTLDEFDKKYADLIRTMHSAKAADGENLLYNAPNSVTFRAHPELMDNIVKMWHSIQSVWDMVQRQEQTTTTHRNNVVKYARVAVLRVDVIYLTPVSLYHYVQNGQQKSVPKDDENDSNSGKVAVIPGFGQFPVSDRGILGARDAVQIWASERFARMHEHVRNPTSVGWGIHSEYFLQSNLLPSIRNMGFQVVQDERWCFLRARPDFSVWTNDCEVKALPSITEHLGDPVAAVSNIIGRPCIKDEKMYQVTIQVARCPP